MGANLANEVADGQFCETTIGCRDLRVAPLLRDVIQTDNFRVVVVDDEDAVEVCGALKVIYITKTFLAELSWRFLYPYRISSPVEQVS